MKVKELNIFDEFAVVKKENVLEAIKIMKNSNVPDLVLVNEGGKPIGIIAAIDILFNVIAEEKDPKKVNVTSIARKVKPFDEDATKDDVFNYMMKSNNEIVPITKKDGTLLGVCTIGDVLLEVEEEEKE